ncbi:MAG: ribonuclease R [Nitrospirota bacterium]
MKKYRSIKKQDNRSPNSAERPIRVAGKLKGHKEGYGFVIPDEKAEKDVYIQKRNMGEAMDGDHVIAQVTSVRNRQDRRHSKSPSDTETLREGRIVQILNRAQTKIVGVFQSTPPMQRPSFSSRGERIKQEERPGGFVVPCNKRITENIFIPKEKLHAAKNGDVVSVAILTYGTPWAFGEGTIEKILGKMSDPTVDSHLAAESYGFLPEFSQQAKEEAATIANHVFPKMCKDRVDLRALQTVTIDGETARDFDDAVSIQKTDHGFFLFVHITDVSHFIREGSALDSEAYARATSVYFPDTVYPMIPPKLSNGILSLNPKADRLTLTAEMQFDSDGNATGYKLYESVIHSDERMTYTDVSGILEKKTPLLLEKYAAHLASFETMKTLALLLRKKRFANGGLDFDIPEPQIKIAPTGEVIGIGKAERNIAHQLIEAFMLVANETVARHLSELSIPSLYRVHDPPDDQKIELFRELSAAFGFVLKKPKRPSSKPLSEALEYFRGKPEEKLIHESLLRSMKQARYSEINTGHFGLSSDQYTHFTSPVRRYPDLIVHRILKQTFKSSLTSDQKEKWELTLPAIAKQTSEREKAATDAEREVVKRKTIRFMVDKVGQTYSGLISGVTSFGFFVQLTDFFVEGLVHVKTLDSDYYLYDEVHHRLVGRRTRRILQIGNPVDVLVEQANLEILEIRFGLVEAGKSRNAARRIPKASGGASPARAPCPATDRPARQKRPRG